MQVVLHFQLSSTGIRKGKKPIMIGVLLTLANRDLFHLPSRSPCLLLLFLLGDPPELHSAELLEFCSTLVFVPFVSVTERGGERRGGRKIVKACSYARGGWLRFRWKGVRGH